MAVFEVGTQPRQRMTREASSAVRQLEFILQEIEEQVNVQLRAVLSSTEISLIDLGHKDTDPESIGEIIIDKVVNICEKLSRTQTDLLSLDGHFQKLTNSYKDLSSRFHTSQDELALSEEKTTEAITDLNKQIITEARLTTRLRNSEILYEELEYRFDDLKKLNLELELQVRTYKNTIAVLQATNHRDRDSINALKEDNVKLAEKIGKFQKSLASLATNTSLYMCDKHLNKENPINSGELDKKPERDEDVTAIQDKLTVVEKRNNTRNWNKKINELSISLNAFIFEFAEISHRYSRLHSTQKDHRRVTHIQEKLEDIDERYMKFLENSGLAIKDQKLEELRAKASIEREEQYKLLESLENLFPETKRTSSVKQSVSEGGVTENKAKDILKQSGDKSELAGNVTGKFPRHKVEESETKENLTKSLAEEFRDQDLIYQEAQANHLIMAVSVTDMLKLVNQTIPEYSGCTGPNSQQELGRFLDCADLLYDVYREHEANRRQFMALLKMKFRGDAYDLVNRSTFENYEALKKLLFKTYLPSRNLVELSGELQRSVQRTGETTKEFVRRLRGLLNDWNEQMRRCYEEVNKQTVLYEEKEKEIVLVFKKGLSNMKLREYLMMNNKDTLNEIEEVALKFEETSRLYTSAETYPSTANQPCRAIEQMGLQQYQESPVQQPRRETEPHSSWNVPRGGPAYNQYGPGDTYNRGNSPRTLKCAYCGVPGHTKSRCRKLQNIGYCRKCQKEGHWLVDCTSNVTLPDDRESNNREFFCYDCGQSGHISRNCPGTRRQTETASAPMATSGNGNVLARDMGARTQ